MARSFKRMRKQAVAGWHLLIILGVIHPCTAKAGLNDRGNVASVVIRPLYNYAHVMHFRFAG